MSMDWIKMRVDLQSHPKIVRILSAMNRTDVQNRTDKFRAIGGLHAVWCVFDTHSTDGKLHGYTPETMDHVIGWSGFSAAMISVGWMVWDGEQTLTMPEFSEHNGKGAKRRAEDQKRKKNVRKESEERPQNVRNLSDKKRTREREREREEVNPPIAPPDGLDMQAWERWVEYRNQIHKAIKPASMQAAQRELSGFGSDQSAVVEQSIAAGWQGLFALKAKPKGSEPEPLWKTLGYPKESDYKRAMAEGSVQ